MVEQLAVRVTGELLRRIDELIAQGRFPNRADLVRSAVAALVEVEQRRLTGEAIAEGYRRIPQSDEDVAAASVAAIRSIHEEPW